MNRRSVSGLRLPPVIVGSLTDSHDQPVHITRQLASAGVLFEFFCAERIGKYPPNYDVSTRLKTYASHLTLGAMGCYDGRYRI